MLVLKNCPFCGSEKELFSMPREMFISNGVSKNVGWSCICAHCDAHVWGREQEDTEATWNTRPIEDALQARIDELQFKLDSLCTCIVNPQDERYQVLDPYCPIHGHREVRE